MGNVNLPTPVALAGGAMCILGGYLLGVVLPPEAPSRSTATVDSYDTNSRDLCLTSEAIEVGVEAGEGSTEPGVLCGTWRRSQGSSIPEPGDQFRFVSMIVDASRKGESGGAGPVTVIYGDVVG